MDIYNFAPVPVGEKFEHWIDPNSPLQEPIPVGSQWLYTVHPVLPTDDPESPLKAGPLAGPPSLNVKDAERLAEMVENSGWFACIYAALIIADRGKLN
jgi:hypothetical protein